MIGNRRGKRRDEHQPDYCLYDLETTGTSYRQDKIIEISAVKVRNGEVVDEFSMLVNPECPISPFATAINGITDEMVAGKPTIAEVLPDFLAFIGEDVLVGHNVAAFDMNFIYRECEALYKGVPDNDFIDTLYYARRKLPELPHHKLTDLATHYGISTEGAHRALADCRMNQKVFEFLSGEPDGKLKRPPAKDVRKCPKCGRNMKKRNGKFGEFYGCSGFPMCNYTENI